MALSGLTSDKNYKYTIPRKKCLDGMHFPKLIDMWKDPIEMVNDPGVLKLANVSINAALAFFGAIQLSSVRERKSRSKSFSQLAKLAMTVTYGIVGATLYKSTAQTATLTSLATSLAVYLPLLLLQVDYSEHYHASVLLFWGFNAASTFREILVGENHLLTLQSILFSSSFVILILETFFHEYSSKSIISQWTVSWVYPLISSIYVNGDITVADVPKLPNYISADTAYERWKKYWDISYEGSVLFRRKKGTPSLIYAVTRANAPAMVANVLYSLLGVSFSFLKPILFRKLLIFYEEINSTDSIRPSIAHGITITIGLYAITVAEQFRLNLESFNSLRLKNSVHSAVSVAIHKKAFMLSAHSRKQKSTAEIGRLISSDAPNIDVVSKVMSTLIKPIEMVCTLVLLINLLGKGLIGGAIVGCMLFPVTKSVSKKFGNVYGAMSSTKDKRVGFLNELLASIKTVKLYCWQAPILSKLQSLREGELSSIAKFGINYPFINHVRNSLPMFINAACFATFAYVYDYPLTADKVFPALSLISKFTSQVLSLPGLDIHNAGELDSVKRITEFLLLDEVDPENGGLCEIVEDEKFAVNIKNCTFLWSTKSNDASLDGEKTSNVAFSHVDFFAAKGVLTCIVGKVGSGKSTLLRSILGELPIEQENDTKNTTNPSIQVSGNFAYCPQVPWLFNASVRENILFGHEYEPEFYMKTLKCCQLIPDLESLPNGDRTIIGEKGVSLSTGQKARISLARAVYSRADIIVLDDILSAVDAHVGRAIIEEVLSPNGLVGDKTKILVTNSMSILPLADKIYLVENQSISESGDYDSVKRTGKLGALIDEFGDDSLITKSFTKTPRQATTSRASVAPFDYEYDFGDEENGNEKAGKSESTSVSRYKLLWEYCKACNLKYVFAFIVCLTLVKGAQTLQKAELARLTEKSTSAVFPLGLYVFYGILYSCLALLRSYVMWKLCIPTASKHYHDALTNTLVSAPMSYFETTPIGTILNTFTQDLNSIDMMLPWMIISFVNELINALSTSAFIFFASPPSIIVLAAIGTVFTYYRHISLPASRQLEKLNASVQGLLSSHLSESIGGRDTINAFNQSSRFLHKTVTHLNTTGNLHIIYMASFDWTSTRFTILAESTVLLASGAAILSVLTSNPLSTATVGVVLSYALDTTSTLESLSSFMTQVETHAASIERVDEFTKLKSEGPSTIQNCQPDQGWPRIGDISFNNYSAKYRDNMEPVLKNISFSVKAKEKIGVVGRTGAGKSSLAMALFRIIQGSEGNVFIDDIDTNSIGLYDLRSKLNIIPQETFLFKASVRENLDPFGKYSDEDLWNVLELAQLKTFVQSMGPEKDDSNGSSSLENSGLNAQISEEGSNMSAGQKQLFGLARALLKKESKILVFDEATASVDVQTDKIIQSIIRKELADKTIITIAHRIDSIKDSDKILVLDAGELKEFDSPERLLSDSGSLFYSLYNESARIRENAPGSSS